METTRCAECAEIKEVISSARIIPVNIEDIVSGPQSEAKDALDFLVLRVNALLNSGGGTLCIHTRKPYLLGLFDHKSDNRLTALISDNSLFHQNFERFFWDDNHVLIRVTYKPRPLSTYAVNSKLLCNTGFQELTHAQTQYWVELTSQQLHQGDIDRTRLSAQNRSGNETPTFISNEPVKVTHGVFQESVSVQVKRIPPEKTTAISITQLAACIWKDLRLPHYISAFSKLPHGGSVYFGIREEQVTGDKKWKQVKAARYRQIVLVTDPEFKLWEEERDPVFCVLRNGIDPSALFSSGEDAERRWAPVHAHQDGPLPVRILDKEWRLWKDESGSGVLHIARDGDVPLKHETKTGRFICEGITLTERQCNELRIKIMSKVCEEMMWLSLSDTAHCPVRVNFPHVQNNIRNKNLRVVEVAVDNFHGVGFYQKTGPESYQFVPQSPGEPKRLPLKTWVERYRGTLLECALI